jgi:hypothetical protein
MIRLSLDTLWVLERTGDERAIEAIHDYMFAEMEGDRYGIYYDATDNEIHLTPMEITMTTEKKSNKHLEGMLDLAAKNLAALKSMLIAAKSWVHHFGRNDKE